MLVQVRSVSSCTPSNAYRCESTDLGLMMRRGGGGSRHQKPSPRGVRGCISCPRSRGSKRPLGGSNPLGTRLVRELLRALMPTLMSSTGGGEGGAYISTSQCQDGIGITEGCDRVRRLKSRVARYPSPLRRWRVAGSRGPARGMVVVGNRYRLVCLGADQLLGASAGTWSLSWPGT